MLVINQIAFITKLAQGALGVTYTLDATPDAGVPPRQRASSPTPSAAASDQAP